MQAPLTRRDSRCGYTGEDGFEVSVSHKVTDIFCAHARCATDVCALASTQDVVHVADGFVGNGDAVKVLR